MSLNINLLVDFAFKKTFGSPDGVDALIELLNAILNFDAPLTSVEILNPFSYQEFESDKQIVLDIRARDQAGQLFNVEMQLGVVQGLQQRLVFYCSSLYVSQLSSGQPYRGLHTTVSVCLLGETLFPDTDQAHHRFELMDQPSGRRIEQGLEIHIVELRKYNTDASSLRNASNLEQWIFLLCHSEQYRSESLRALLPNTRGFESAIRSLEIISEKTKDKKMYDARTKALMDHKWMLEDAMAKGIEQGIERGIERGIEEGIEAGELIGKIQLLEQLLNRSNTDHAKLKSESIEQLTRRLADLQEAFRQRRT